jgi:predicted ester cyclase
MSTVTNRAILQRAVENFNRADNRTGYFDLYDDNVVLHGFSPGLAPGVEGVKQFYGALWAAFPDCRLTIDDLISEGDRIAVRYTLSGTHQREFMGIPPTSKHISLAGFTILRFPGGKCVERWRNQANRLGLMQQLGAIPAPAQAGR